MNDSSAPLVAEAERLCAEREKRINDAIALRKPDRVPVWHGAPGPYPAQCLGISPEKQMMDVERCLEASLQTALYYQSDMVQILPPIGATLAPLGYRHLRWANHGLAADSGWQFVDEEVMKPEEYNELIYDPSDFMVRKYWPRAYSELAGLAALAPLREDMRRAKEVLGHKACLAGNVPIAPLMGPSGQTEDVKIENVKAMVDFTKEYGG